MALITRHKSALSRHAVRRSYGVDVRTKSGRLQRSQFHPSILSQLQEHTHMMCAPGKLLPSLLKQQLLNRVVKLQAPLNVEFGHAVEKPIQVLIHGSLFEAHGVKISEGALNTGLHSGGIACQIVTTFIQVPKIWVCVRLLIFCNVLI